MYPCLCEVRKSFCFAIVRLFKTILFSAPLFSSHPTTTITLFFNKNQDIQYAAWIFSNFNRQFLEFPSYPLPNLYALTGYLSLNYHYMKVSMLIIFVPPRMRRDVLIKYNSWTKIDGFWGLHFNNCNKIMPNVCPLHGWLLEKNSYVTAVMYGNEPFKTGLMRTRYAENGLLLHLIFTQNRGMNNTERQRLTVTHRDTQFYKLDFSSEPHVLAIIFLEKNQGCAVAFFG